MVDAYLYISIDGGEPLDPQTVYGIQFDTSIYSAINKGTLILKDTTGDIFASLSFLIGSEVNVQIVGSEDGGNPTTKVNLPPLYIKDFENDYSINASINAGFITIKLYSKWFFYQDFTDHAYAPNITSKIIQTIVEDSTRGFALTVDTEHFGTSSDVGNVPRYKCGIGDFDFIDKYLKPLCCIESSPTYFFSRNNKICLESFNSLYGKKASTLIIPNMKIGDSVSSEIQSYAKSVGTSSMIFALKFYPSVGSGRDGSCIFKSVYPDVYLFDDFLHVNQVIQTMPSVKISKKTDTKSGNAIPINKYLSMGVTGTDTTLYNMKFIEDIKAITYNKNENLNQMFMLQVITNFCGDSVFLGDTIECFIPSVSKVTGSLDISKQHWLSGKWLVSDISHVVENGKVNVVSSVLTLMRPTLVLDETKTSVTSLSSMARIS